MGRGRALRAGEVWGHVALLCMCPWALWGLLVRCGGRAKR